jgi:hypothetical protein
MTKIAFLAQMILKLVPLADKLVDETGTQASSKNGLTPRFTVDEVARLVDISHTPERPTEDADV